MKKRERVLTSFEIGELKEPWKAYCAANDVTCGQALCEVIRKLTGVDRSLMPKAVRGVAATKPPRLYRQTPEPERGKSTRLYLYLTPSEWKAVDARAKADGFAHPTQWTLALIRARLTDQPQFGADEIAELRESNHQLLAIGRNLNQIAHGMNLGEGRWTAIYDGEEIRNLAKAVKRHVQKVGEVLRASIARWRLD